MRRLFSRTRSVAPFLFSERGSLQLTRSLRHVGGGSVTFSEDEDQSHLSLSGEHSGHDLSGRQISDSRTSSSDCRLTALQLEETTWLRCLLRRARLSDLKADRSCWEVVDLEGTVFEGSSAREARFSLVSFRDAQFQDLDLTEAVFVLCDFSGASWRRVNLEGARFVGCDFEGAVFEEGVNLAGADLRGNSLRRAWLGGADLGGARVTRADFRGALGLSGLPEKSKALEAGGALLSKSLLGTAWQNILGSGPSAHRRVLSAVSLSWAALAVALPLLFFARAVQNPIDPDQLPNFEEQPEAEEAEGEPGAAGTNAAGEALDGNPADSTQEGQAGPDADTPEADEPPLK